MFYGNSISTVKTLWCKRLVVTFFKKRLEAEEEMVVAAVVVAVGWWTRTEQVALEASPTCWFKLS